MENKRKLVLGTAQLGTYYGIANSTGQPSEMDAKNIIDLAWKSGIREIDTAQAYGQSEELVGKAIEEMGVTREAIVTTKLDPKLNHLDRDEMMRALEKSLKRLRVEKLNTLMLHSEGLLDHWNSGISEIANSMIRSEKIAKIGVSVYSPLRAAQAISYPGISVIQVPANYLDRRFEKAEIFEKARNNGKEIYIRSVFLQGLLLLEADKLPPKMALVLPILNELQNLAIKYGVEVRSILLGYIKYTKLDAKIVVGVERLDQLVEIISDFDKVLPKELLDDVSNSILSTDEWLIDPSKW